MKLNILYSEIACNYINFGFFKPTFHHTDNSLFKKQYDLRNRNSYNMKRVTKRSDKTQSYRYISNFLIGFPTIISYFKLFPLKTIKKEAFIKWSNIYTMMINKEHLNQEGLTKIKVLAKLVNDKSGIND